MNKLLMTGLLTAVVAAGAQAEGTGCNPGSFYAGFNAGFATHKAQLRIKDGVTPDGTAAKLLKEMQKVNGQWRAGALKAQTEHDNAKKDSAEKTKASDTALTAAKDAYRARLVELLKADEATPGQLGVGATALPTTTKLQDLKGLTKLVFDELRKQDGIFAAKVDGTQLDAAITDATHAKKYNEAMEKVVVSYVDQLFEKGSIKIDKNDVFTTEKVLLAADGATFTDFDAKQKDTVPVYNKAKDEADKAAAALKTAEATLKTENDKVAAFEAAFGTDKEAKITDLASDDSIAKKTAEINKLEMNELLKANEKYSKTKSSFIAEALIGVDYRLGDTMVGANLFVGLDTVNSKIYKSSAKKDEDKSYTNGVKVKRPFYVGVAPTIGFMVTPEMELYFTAGAQLGKYKIDTTGMAVDFAHTQNLIEQADALNKFREDQIAKAVETKDEDAKKFAEGVSVISTDETFSARNEQCKKYNTTKMSPIIGAGVKYAFTPNVFGTLQYKYQFNTKILGYDKSGDLQAKNQNHTVSAGVGIRF